MVWPLVVLVESGDVPPIPPRGVGVAVSLLFVDLLNCPAVVVELLPVEVFPAVGRLRTVLRVVIPAPNAVDDEGIVADRRLDAAALGPCYEEKLHGKNHEISCSSLADGKSLSMRVQTWNA